jgi:hypothetical protein
METAVLREKMKPTFGIEIQAASKWMSPWLAGLKTQIAQIAVAKSLQQFGREEEKT